MPTIYLYKIITIYLKDILDVQENDWEAMLYSCLRDYETLPLLPSYTRVTVEGTVDSVRKKILNIFNNLH